MAFQPGNKAAVGADHSRRKVLTQALIAELNEIDPKTKMTRLRNIVRALIENAEAKDNQAIMAIFDRIEGRPVQAIANDDDGAPFVIQIVRGGAKE
jgi:predicted transcriptional regulator